MVSLDFLGRLSVDILPFTLDEMKTNFMTAVCVSPSLSLSLQEFDLFPNMSCEFALEVRGHAYGDRELLSRLTFITFVSW